MRENRRVLIAHAFYRQFGGEDQYVHQQVDLLQKYHTVQLLSLRNDELVSRFRTLKDFVYSRQRERDVVEEIRAFRPHVIHLHNPYPAFGPAVHLAASRLRIPLVQTVHNLRLRCPNGYMFTEGSVCRRCERGMYIHAAIHDCFPDRTQAASYAASLWLHRFILHLNTRVTRFVAPSNFMLQRLRSWDISTEKISLIRNFTDIPEGSDFSPGLYGMYLGRLSHEKGLNVLLAALVEARDPRFVFVGDGPARHSLEQETKRLALRNTVFRGEQSRQRVDALLRESRFLVIPSVWEENAPLAALEALARARPLVVADIGGLSELAMDGQGLIFPPSDSHGLARHIRKLMIEDDLCQQMGAKARSFAEARLSGDKHAADLERLYESLTL